MIADLSGERIAQNTLFSRRRRARRRPQPQGKYRLPDWVWGLAIGMLVLIVGGGVFFVTSLGGGGGGCDEELPPLPGAANVTAEGFQTEDDALAETIGYLNQGDLDNTFATFYGDVHAFTHNIDPEVRAVDEDIAKELCELVNELEEEYDPPPPEQRSLARMASATIELRELLRDVAEVMGFPRPGG